MVKENDCSSMIRVKGYSQSLTGVWYDIEIPSYDPSCHTTNVVRRRYKDFKILHTAIFAIDALCPLLPVKSTAWEKITGLSSQIPRFCCDELDEFLCYVQLHAQASLLDEYDAFLCQSPQPPLNGGKSW